MPASDLVPLPDPLRFRSLLAVAPHPDDTEIGAGAYIARLAAQGCRIRFVTVTDGAMGTRDPATDPRALAARRRQEAVDAARRLGVEDVVFYDHPDLLNDGLPGLWLRLVGELRRMRPDAVLTVDPELPYEAHPDHVAVGRQVLTAALFAPLGRLPVDEPPAPSPAVILHSTHAPNRVISAGPYWAAKVAAVRAHASQFPSEEAELLLGYLALRGAEWPGAEGPAEAFRVLDPRHLHMNVDAGRV